MAVPFRVVHQRGILVAPTRPRGIAGQLTGRSSRQASRITFDVVTMFDRNVIKTNWKAINESPLKRAGLLVRKIAIQSIRHVGFFTPKGRRGKPSRRNKQTGLYGPPKSRSARKPFKLIYSVPVINFREASVYVGMVGLPGKSKNQSRPAPSVHEFGLTISRKSRVGRRIARYPKRAFMAPALSKAKVALPGLWKRSIA